VSVILSGVTAGCGTVANHSSYRVVRGRLRLPRSGATRTVALAAHTTQSGIVILRFAATFRSSRREVRLDSAQDV
jgi:hypothetical protein